MCVCVCVYVYVYVYMCVCVRARVRLLVSCVCSLGKFQRLVAIIPPPPQTGFTPLIPHHQCRLLISDWVWRVYTRGGGGTSIGMHIGYVPRERPLIFSPKFPFRNISFSQMTQKSGPEHHHFTFFAVPETIIFKISLIAIASHDRLSPNSKRSAAPRFSGRPECQPDASWQFRKPAFSRSTRLKLGPELAPHFHAQYTAQAPSVRSPAFSRSTVELGPEPGPISHFSAAHSYQNLGWIPPPPPGGLHLRVFDIRFLPKFGVNTPPPRGGGGFTLKSFWYSISSFR